MADYFTTAVRTGSDGMTGISFILIPAKSPGIKIRKMETQFDSSLSISFITFDKVKVPAKNLIGEENMGFVYMVHNFNHERLMICIATARACRLCYEKSFEYAT